MEIRKNNKGQSTLEFIMTFSLAVGFLFLFLKMALNYTNGYMVQHATFMASRAYLVSDEDRADLGADDIRAFAKAKEVFTTYLPEGLVSGVEAGNLAVNSPEASITKFHAYVGLYTKYEQKFALGIMGGKEIIRFVSESFLGREPTRRESRTQVCAAIKSAGLSNCDVHVTLEDNGG